jgi:hypothetical protein
VSPQGRHRAQLAARLGGLVFVAAWLFSTELQSTFPFWLPFLILAATELEFLTRGLRDSRVERAPAAERRLPGEHDADLGWVEAEGDDGEPMLLPAPAAARRRSRGVPYALGVVLAVALFFVALRVDTRATWSSLSPQDRALAERRFAIEAKEIAGRPVTISCDEQYAFTGAGSDAAGVAFVQRGLAYLEPDVCRSLHDLISGTDRPSREDAAWAITVLAHEATHLRGIRDEAVTECYALQEGVRLGIRLGLAPAEARDRMRAQLERDLADRSIGRFGYRLSGDCRNGGKLDLHPGDPSFP